MRNQRVAALLAMFVRGGGASAQFSITESGSGRCSRGRSEQVHSHCLSPLDLLYTLLQRELIEICAANAPLGNAYGLAQIGPLVACIA